MKLYIKYLIKYYQCYIPSILSFNTLDNLNLLAYIMSKSSLFGIQYGCSGKKLLNFGFPSSFLTALEQQQKVQKQPWTKMVLIFKRW